MHVVRIAPLAALPNTVPQVLDYFWTSPLSEGALVSVLIGRRAVNAIVLECLDLARAKLSVKKAGFGLKKISSVISEAPQATTTQLALSRWMARQYHAPLGLCLKTVLPSFIGKQKKLLILPVYDEDTSRTRTGKPLIILSQPDTTLAEIERIISDTHGQVLIITPEVSLACHLAERMASHHPVLVHSGIGARAYRDAYQGALDGTARIVIGTRLALFLPFKELAEVVVEDPLHEAYKSEMAPRYNAPDVARQVADLSRASLTYLTPSLSAVNRYLIDKDLIRSTDRKPHWPKIVHADMVAELQSGNRSLLSRAVQEELLDAYDESRPILLLSPRRAYASTLACQRCHKPVVCMTCAIPMRVHRYENEDTLICYHCTAFTPAPKQCLFCKGGPLRPSGLAGSQKIAEAVNTCLDRHGLRKLKIPILDSDLIRSAADEENCMVQLDAMEHPVLVATQMVFSHRYARKFDRIAVIEADALAYNPDFRTQERLAYQLEKLADFHPSKLHIQSWDRAGALARAENRSWDDFYNEELVHRKLFGWPPFSRLVKLSYSHQERLGVDRAARVAAEKLRRTAVHLGIAKAMTILGPTPALVQKAGGRWTQHIILKSSLAPERLSELLDHVPAGWTVDVDPRSIT